MEPTLLNDCNDPLTIAHKALILGLPCFVLAFRYLTDRKSAKEWPFTRPAHAGCDYAASASKLASTHRIFALGDRLHCLKGNAYG